MSQLINNVNKNKKDGPKRKFVETNEVLVVVVVVVKRH
jgi:hypothetical protein